ncbi:MAG: hypothetical protein OEZ36_10225, partial [Spirochaetota bacterium]|nr:hypothetical protein [Spirochaetota bacterium]
KISGNGKNNISRTKELVQVVPEEFKSKTEEFFSTIKKAENQNILLIIKGYPDPDSIASSLALQYIASFYGISCTILHFDEISHPENKALVKKLGIDLVEYDDNFDISHFQYVAFNDTQTIDLPIQLPEHIVPLILVDHHKNLGLKECIFTDIRENSGSTCAIYTEYLIQGPLELESGDPEAVRLATALMHGIRTDTDNFVIASDIDFLASAYLSRITDRDLLSVISHQSVSAKTMDITETALQNKDIRGTFLFAGVGFVREEDRDGIGQAADYLLRREGIETVIVYGIVGGKYIDGSLRTTSHTLDPDKWIKDLFGVSTDGKPFGGGRRDKGGFQLPLSVFARCKDKDLLWQVTRQTIEDIFYKKIGIERETENGEAG